MSAQEKQHIVAAGGQELCECEQERAAILEHDGGMTREGAEKLVAQFRREIGAHRPCDSCPRAKG